MECLRHSSVPGPFRRCLRHLGGCDKHGPFEVLNISQGLGNRTAPLLWIFRPQSVHAQKNGQGKNVCQLDYSSRRCAFVNSSSNERTHVFVRQLKRLAIRKAHTRYQHAEHPTYRADEILSLFASLLTEYVRRDRTAATSYQCANAARHNPPFFQKGVADHIR